MPHLCLRSVFSPHRNRYDALITGLFPLAVAVIIVLGFVIATLIQDFKPTLDLDSGPIHELLLYLKGLVFGE
jgi:hypothetical protein